MTPFWITTSKADIPSDAPQLRVIPARKCFQPKHVPVATPTLVAVQPPRPPNRLKTKRGRPVSDAEKVLAVILYGDRRRHNELTRHLAKDKDARKIIQKAKTASVCSDRSSAPIEARAICLIDPDSHRAHHGPRASNDDLQTDDDPEHNPPAATAPDPGFLDLYAGVSDPISLLASFAGSQTSYNSLASIVSKLTGKGDAPAAPIDRMTVFIHWFGWELALPSKDLRYFQDAHSISGYVLGFLSTIAVAGGAPELVPFIRYISLYCEFELKGIESQSNNRGVILSATWILPMAIVPRPWDIAHLAEDAPRTDWPAVPAPSSIESLIPTSLAPIAERSRENSADAEQRPADPGGSDALNAEFLNDANEPVDPTQGDGAGQEAQEPEDARRSPNSRSDQTSPPRPLHS